MSSRYARSSDGAHGEWVAGGAEVSCPEQRSEESDA